MRRQLAASVCLVLVLLAGCGGSGPGSPTAPAEIGEDQVEVQSFNLVNRSRQSEQVEPQLALDMLLAEVARDHSRAMRDQGFFAHVDPSGSNLRDRLRAAGVTFRSAGENLAQVQNAADPARQAHRFLMDSDSHRRNILGSQYSLLGVGVAGSGSQFWITQVYLEP